MSDRIPYGQIEGPRLEFKGADALKDPRIIARNVVAMLNAEGGAIWIGVREEAERAVAIESVPDPEVQKRRLQDFLVDTIEPSLSSREVQVEVVREGEVGILRVYVAREADRRPYAFLKEGGRHFLTRVGGRVRPMTREEIFERAGSPGPTDGLKEAEGALAEELKALFRQRSPEGLFWLRIFPVPELGLDLSTLIESDLLIDPTLSGNSRTGQNFSLALRGRMPVLRAGHVFLGEVDDFSLVIDRHQGFKFRAPLRIFHAGKRGEERKPLWFRALLEIPISIFRLLSVMLRQDELWERRPNDNTVFLSTLGMLGLDGWSLRPYSPAIGWLSYLRNPARFTEAPDLVLPKPLQFKLGEIRDYPDRCGFRLARRIYEAFGYSVKEMPPEYDQERDRLALPN